MYVVGGSGGGGEDERYSCEPLKVMTESRMLAGVDFDRSNVGGGRSDRDALNEIFSGDGGGGVGGRGIDTGTTYVDEERPGLAAGRLVDVGEDGVGPGGAGDELRETVAPLLLVWTTGTSDEGLISLAILARTYVPPGFPSVLEVALLREAWSPSIRRFFAAASRAASSSLPSPPPPPRRLPPTSRGSGTPLSDAELGVVGRPPPPPGPCERKLTESS